MKSNLTIVMYHYVRDLARSRYPGIKGLELAQFKEQLRYIKKHYTPISAYELMDATESDAKLPPNAALLSFDDAYAEHFTHVFPILDENKISGCFFPPAKCILENLVLDVNKIHFILASVEDIRILVEFINNSLEELRGSHNLRSNDFYWKECAVANRWDPAEINFVKRMLQRDLPEDVRGKITDTLFTRFVASDEEAFSNELYMNTDQIACLQRNGMYVGSHGHNHYWLNAMSEEEQRNEINLSLRFLDSIGSDPSRWIMCYPYGAYNESTISILEENNCRAALTTSVGIAEIGKDHPMKLPRLDTNDLPIDSRSGASDWTLKGMRNG